MWTMNDDQRWFVDGVKVTGEHDWVSAARNAVGRHSILGVDKRAQEIKETMATPR